MDIWPIKTHGTATDYTAPDCMDTATITSALMVCFSTRSSLGFLLVRKRTFGVPWVFMGQMSILSPVHQCQGTEGNWKHWLLTGEIDPLASFFRHPPPSSEKGTYIVAPHLPPSHGSFASGWNKNIKITAVNFTVQDITELGKWQLPLLGCNLAIPYVNSQYSGCLNKFARHLTRYISSR